MANEIDPKEAARIDAAKIEAVLAEINAPVNPPAPKPAPVPVSKAKPAKVKSAPVAVAADSGAGARVEEGDDFEDTDFDTPSNAGRRVPEGNPAAKPGPAHVPVVPTPADQVVIGPHGYPVIDADPDVRAAVANVQRLEEQLREATAEADKSAAVLGIKFNVHNPARVEAVAERLLAEGKPLDDVDAFEARCKLVRRLGGALDLAKKAVHPAREVAVRRLNSAAQEPLKATFLALHKARVPFVRAVLAHRENLARQQASGFLPGNDWSGFTTEIPLYRDHVRSQFRELVNRGIFTAEEVRDLLEA